MKTAIFSAKNYERDPLVQANRDRHELVFLEPRLSVETAALARGCRAVSVFVNDCVDGPVLELLASGGVHLVALRCAGYNNVDLDAARRLGVTVGRVPAYSPYAVAEHTVGMILTLNRKLHRAYNRVREGNFSLEGLLGFDLHGRTVGLVGTGKIGAVAARILAGFGCRLLVHDPVENPEVTALGARYVSLQELFQLADVISLHCPLTPETRHMVDADALSRMKRGAMLINTSRGALVDTPAVVEALKSGQLGYLGLDVYEEEGPLFFQDLSLQAIQDDVFTRLLTFPNVLITGHQAFFTREALINIAETTLENITAFETGVGVLHRVA